MCQLLFIMSLFGPILVTGKLTCSGPDWSLFGANCYKTEDKFNYLDAIRTCHDLGGYVIMPKTEVEMIYFKNLRNGIADEVWIGLKELNSDGIWTWADGSVASDQGIVFDADNSEDCARLRADSKVWDTACSNSYKTICQRDANLETTSIIDITSSQGITTTHTLTSEGPIFTTETDLFETTSTHLSTYTETSFESSTSYSASSGSHAPEVLSTPSSGISTNSSGHCTYVFICSNHVNKTQDSPGFIYKVDTKQLSSYKRKHQSVSDPRNSSLYIGSVGIAVLVLIILLIMFLDCVPTKV